VADLSFELAKIQGSYFLLLLSVTITTTTTTTTTTATLYSNHNRKEHKILRIATNVTQFIVLKLLVTLQYISWND